MSLKHLSPPGHWLVIPLVLVWLPLLLFVTWRLGVQHDYIHYLDHWAIANAGGDPWAPAEGVPSNTYGLLFYIIGIAVSIHPLVPKLVMVSLFGISVIALAARLSRSEVSSMSILLFLALLIANPLVWISVAVYGNNDALIAALVIAAALAQFSNHRGWAGVWLALAALTKYYPGLLVPAFSIGGWRRNQRLLLTFIVTVVLGLTLSFIVWGTGLISSLLFAGERDASLLSVLYAWSQLPGDPGEGVRTFLVQWNALIVIGCWLAVLWLAFHMRLSWAETAVLTSAAFLAAYKVGHTQFYLVLCVLCAALLLQNDVRSRRLVLIFIPLLGAIAAFQVDFFLRTSVDIQILGDPTPIIGWFIAPLTLATIATGFWSLRVKRLETIPAS